MIDRRAWRHAKDSEGGCCRLLLDRPEDLIRFSFQGKDRLQHVQSRLQVLRVLLDLRELPLLLQTLGNGGLQICQNLRPVLNIVIEWSQVLIPEPGQQSARNACYDQY